MKKLVTLTIVIFATALLTSLLTVVETQAASAASSNSVSGIVFYDMDKDGMQTPDEEAAADVLIHIQAVDGGLTKKVTASDAGFFNTGELAYGKYQLQTEINGQMNKATTIEVSEINGAAIVYLPVTRSFNILLPFITH